MNRNVRSAMAKELIGGTTKRVLSGSAAPDTQSLGYDTLLKYLTEQGKGLRRLLNHLPQTDEISLDGMLIAQNVITLSANLLRNRREMERLNVNAQIVNQWLDEAQRWYDAFYNLSSVLTEFNDLTAT